MSLRDLPNVKRAMNIEGMPTVADKLDPVKVAQSLPSLDLDYWSHINAGSDTVRYTDVCVP